MSPKPSIEPYLRHAILCAGKICDPKQDRKLVAYLKQKVEEEGLSLEVRVNRAGCLGVCSHGAIMVVYPEGIWYCNVDRGAIDRIVEEHFKQDKPVASLVFHINNPVSV